MKKSIEPALLELATGAGKSWIAAQSQTGLAQTQVKSVGTSAIKEPEQKSRKVFSNWRKASVLVQVLVKMHPS